MVPRAVLLLEVMGGPASKVKDLFQSAKRAGKAGVELTQNVMEDIKPYIIDAAVFAGKGSIATCTIFEQLIPDLATKPYYILRDITTRSTPEYSLNLCSDALIPYWVEKFKLGSPSPGSANDCNGAQFILEDNIYSVIPEHLEAALSPPAEEAEQGQQEEDRLLLEGDDSEQGASCSSSCSHRDYAGITQAQVSLMLHQRQAVAQSSQGYALTDPEIAAEERTCESQQRKREYTSQVIQLDADSDEEEAIEAGPQLKKMKESVEKDDLESETHWSPEWTAFLDNKEYGNLMYYLDRTWFFPRTETRLKSWAGLDMNTETPMESKLYCRICREYWDPTKWRQQQKPKFVDGITFEEIKGKGRNHFKKLLRAHLQGARGSGASARQLEARGALAQAKDPIHQQILSHATLTKASQSVTTEQELDKHLAEQKTAGKYLATSRVFHIVNFMLRSNIALFKMPEMITFQETVSGVSFGKHHRDRVSAMRMAHSISTFMHRNLLKYLAITYDGPLAIIVDGTTDRTMHHQFCIIVRAMEDGRPMDYFYSAVDLGSDQTAEGHMTAIDELFQQDSKAFEGKYNIKQAMKDRLIGFGSDGASTMVGKNNGLIMKL